MPKFLPKNCVRLTRRGQNMPFTLATHRCFGSRTNCASSKDESRGTQGNTRYQIPNTEYRQQQLSLACLLSSGCQSQRVPMEVLYFGILTRGSSSRRQAGASCRVDPPWLWLSFPISYSDAWCCLLRCTAGANRRHLTLTFRSPLPSKEFQPAGNGTKGQRPVAFQNQNSTWVSSWAFGQKTPLTCVNCGNFNTALKY